MWNSPFNSLPPVLFLANLDLRNFWANPSFGFSKTQTQMHDFSGVIFLTIFSGVSLIKKKKEKGICFPGGSTAF